MILEHPIQISSRLMPAVVVGDAWVSAEQTSSTDHRGAPNWSIYVDLADGTEHVDTVSSWHDHREVIACALSFLGACAESRDFTERTGIESEHADMFPETIGAWAQANDDELSMVRFEIEGDDS